jgi:hypothetical protein
MRSVEAWRLQFVLTRQVPQKPQAIGKEATGWNVSEHFFTASAASFAAQFNMTEQDIMSE